MKITNLHISKLYNNYNYKVNFNNDVTFIYGMNGCGKTTILNITEAIITGKLYNLFEYEFEKIELAYSKRASSIEVRTITIINKNKLLEIYFEEEKYVLEKNFRMERIRSKNQELLEMHEYYFSEYDFLTMIKKVFNYVYLPLNRLFLPYEFNERNDYFIRSRLRNRKFNDKFESMEETSMEQVEILIYKHFSEINLTVSEYNDAFRNDVLKSLLEIEVTSSPKEILLKMLEKKETINKLTRSVESYVNILRELEILDESEVEKYREKFNALIDTFDENSGNDTSESSLNMLLNFKDLLRINNIVELAKKMEQRKEKARKPIETFLDTINEFIYEEFDRKELKIDERGSIYFETKYNESRTGIENLSSGEKQLVTFFANLIFGVKSKRSGIFVVDEPELSLHLNWQKKFVEKALEINSNIQFIFATHSPEIIGRNRNKMFRLKKEYISEEK